MLRRLAEVVAAWFVQWLPPEAASFANFPWGGLAEPSAEEPGPDGVPRRRKRRRARARRSARAHQPRD